MTTRDYVTSEGQAKRLGAIPTCVVVEGNKQRVYLPVIYAPLPKELPGVDTNGLDVELAPNPRDVWCHNFGLKTPVDLFTPRQLVALTTFSDLLAEARVQIRRDAVDTALPKDDIPLCEGGIGARAYAEAVSVYLAFGVDKSADIIGRISVPGIALGKI